MFLPGSPGKFFGENKCKHNAAVHERTRIINGVETLIRANDESLMDYINRWRRKMRSIAQPKRMASAMSTAATIAKRPPVDGQSMHSASSTSKY